MEMQEPRFWRRLCVWWSRGMHWLHLKWMWVREVVAVLALVRFSLLIPVILAAALVFADQMVDMLQAVGEEGQLGDGAWLLLMSAFAGLTVWYAARTMFQFQFAGNPASDPLEHADLKRRLPRALGVAVPGLLAVRVALLACSSKSSGYLWVSAAALALVAVAIGAYMVGRRELARRTGQAWIASSVEQEPRNLARLKLLPTVTKSVLWSLLGANAVALVLFMYPWASGMGAPALLLFGLGLTAVTGSLLVYAANHYAVPVLTLLVIWVVAWSPFNDNHRVRVTGASESHGTVPRNLGFGEVSSLGQLKLGPYFDEWWQELVHLSPGEGAIPVVVVAAEGGGVRAAYWSASVLATLEDRTSGSAVPFSRRVFAISGVSGGSVGAAAFDAVVARAAERAGMGRASSVTQVETLLGEDFLSPTLGVTLFPDLLQRFVPWAMFNDRAIALEQSWERAWVKGHAGERALLSEPFHRLWAAHPHQVPLLILNSTVVETGQRAIVSPLATVSDQEETAFADVLPVGRLMGTQMPLSTAAHLSARFTYVSPAGLVDTGRAGAARWVRLVDGGYFDNSGAVTAQEIVRAMSAAHERLGATREMRIVVLHLPNEPPNPSAALINSKVAVSGRVLMSETLSPLRTLLATRGARGNQAIGFLSNQKEVTVVSVRPCRLRGDLPLGWVLSRAVQTDLDRQLGSCERVGRHCAAEKIEGVEALLKGDEGKEGWNSDVECAV